MKFFKRYSGLATDLHLNRRGSMAAYVLHRVSGVLLACYLLFHFFSMSKVLSGAQAFNEEMATLASSRFYMGMEWLVVLAVTFHALNGLRLVLIDLLLLHRKEALLTRLVFLVTGVAALLSLWVYLPRLI